MLVIRTSSGIAYNVLITGIKYTVDAGYKNTLGSSYIGSYNRYVLRSDVLITGINYTGLYVTVFQYNVLISGTNSMGYNTKDSVK